MDVIGVAVRADVEPGFDDEILSILRQALQDLVLALRGQHAGELSLREVLGLRGRHHDRDDGELAFFDLVFFVEHERDAVHRAFGVCGVRAWIHREFFPERVVRNGALVERDVQIGCIGRRCERHVRDLRRDLLDGLARAFHHRHVVSLDRVFESVICVTERLDQRPRVSLALGQLESRLGRLVRLQRRLRSLDACRGRLRRRGFGRSASRSPSAAGCGAGAGRAFDPRRVRSRRRSQPARKASTTIASERSASMQGGRNRISYIRSRHRRP